MTHLKIDSKSKSIDVEMELKGEPAPVTFHVGSYSFEVLPDGSGRLSVSQITCSKPWMEIIAQNATANRPISIPEDKAKWMKMVLE